MEYIPYRKDEVVPGSRFYEYLPQQGYAVARVDIRGTGASPGVSTDEYLPQEQQDGVDAVEWLAAQPWCTGHVNMMGISYGGFTSLQVASHRARAPHVDHPDVLHGRPLHRRLPLPRRPDAQVLRRQHVRQHDVSPGTRCRPIPSGRRTGPRSGRSTSPATSRTCSSGSATRPTRTYWRNGSVGGIADRIKCPAFLIGGWRDGYPNPPLRLYQALQVPKKVLIGPWDHRPPDVAVPGPRIDHLHEVVRWLDHWCGGAGQRRHGRAAGRRVHAGGRAAGRRPARVRGRLARRDGLADRRRERERHAPARRRPPRPQMPAPTAPTSSATTRRSASPASSGRAACTSGCRATSGPTRRSR